jgi:regulator of sirC expression with transglutaminase-like and TPR domain
MSYPISPDPSPLEQFSSAAKAKEIDLAKMALLFAMSEYPELDINEEIKALDSLAAGASRRITIKMDPLGKANALSEYLFDEVGFLGNHEDYYDPRNSFLNEVLKRRLGIPITLSLVYMEIGKRLGIVLDGVGMPGHFLLRLKSDHADLYIDPFHRGLLLSEDECTQLLEAIAGQAVPWDRRYLAPVSAIDLISRVIRNVHAIHASRNDTARALNALKWLFAIQQPLDNSVDS